VFAGASWEECKGNEVQTTMIKGYGEKVQTQLAKICKDILDAFDRSP
jgi:14-3-3 protein epsilon